MSDRIFTLEDANRALPLVRSITRDAVRRYHAAKSAIRALEKLKTERTRGLPVEDDYVDRLDRTIEEQLLALRRLIEELEALGCRLRDYERGVVDFPAACLEGESFVYYCWVLGEAAVSHWHGEEEGFSQRRLVGAGASA